MLRWFAAATVVILLYGSIAHTQRSDVARYHAIRKASGCSRESDHCEFPALYTNRHGHPNHCWNHMNGIFPDPLNETFANRSGTRPYDMAPYSTSTSLLFLVRRSGDTCGKWRLSSLTVFLTQVVGILLLLYDAEMMSRDTNAIALSLAWVAASSFELHRAPSEVSRHNDYAAIAPLLTYLGFVAMGVGPGPTKAGAATLAGISDNPWLASVKLTLVAVVILVTYTDVDIALYIGMAMILIGSLRRLLLRDWKPVLTAGVAAFSAVCAKAYGDEATILPWISYNHHHRAECANDLNSAMLEDISHGTWHIMAALAALVYTPPLIGIDPLSDVEYGCVVLIALGTIIAVHTNSDNYAGWITLSYLSTVVLAAAASLRLSPAKYTLVF